MSFTIQGNQYDLNGVNALLKQVYDANGNSYCRATLGLCKALGKSDLEKLVIEFAKEFELVAKKTVDNDPTTSYMASLAGGTTDGFNQFNAHNHLCSVALIFLEDEEVNSDVLNGLNKVASVIFADEKEEGKDTSLSSEEAANYINAANHRFQGGSIYNKMFENEDNAKELILPYVNLTMALRILCGLEIYSDNVEFLEKLEKTL